MEYLAHGSLLSFLQKKDTKNILTMNDMLNMAVNVAAGMNYLEQKEYYSSAILFDARQS